MVRVSKPTERNGAYHLHYLISCNCFQLMRDWKLESLANGTEIAAVLFQTKKGLPLEVVYNFSTQFLENYCYI